MPILIACSPSTGSSLLRRILNRHDEIFCGPETSLLAKNEYYDNWEKYKYTIVKDRKANIWNKGWHDIKGVNLKDENAISSELIRDWVGDSADFKAFVNTYFNNLLESANKKIWAEKTPSNAFAIDDFLEIFPSSKIIHISRNPYDTIASLVNRGMSVFNAISVNLLNTSQCLQYHGKGNYHFLKYEDLVHSPEATLEKLMAFLNLKFDPRILEPSRNEGGIDHMKGWTYKETQGIGSSSVGRFQKLSSENQSKILSGTIHLRSKLDTSTRTMKEICSVLEYEFQDSEADDHKVFFKREMRKDKLKRWLKRSYFRPQNYPIQWIR